MWYDVLILGILFYAMIRGAMKGVVWQLATIAALLLCFVFAESFSLVLAPFIKLAPPLNRWVAMFVLYLISSFVAFAAARSLRGWIEQVKLVEFDRHLGAIFGVLKGALFSLVLTFFAVTLSDSAAEVIVQSHSGYAAAVLMDRLHPVMPEGLRTVLEPYIHQLDRPDMDLHFGDHDHDAPNFDGDEAEDPGQLFREGSPFFDDPPEFSGSSSDSTAGRYDDIPDFSPAPASSRDFPSGNTPGGFPPLPGDTRQPAGSAAARPLPTIEEFARSIPGLVDEQLRRQVVDVLKNSSPDERESLMQRLASGVPGLIRSMTSEPAPPARLSSTPRSVPLPATGESTRLLKEIGEVYSDFPEARKVFIEEIESSLAGIPDRVRQGVLRDWHADLLSVDPDPDPQTDVVTSLDARIVRQMKLAGLSIESLNTALRDRLRRSSQQ
ncbi:MAG: CvpA family protein [Planctomycetaceae bacterium]|nr:CvpA family protein [Planctomycetaceae bacterium]